MDPKKIVGTTPKNPVGRPQTRYVPFTPVLTDHVCILFSISFMVTSDNQIREFQLGTLLTLHQHFLQAEKVLPDSAPYLNGMYQAITMLHMNMSSLICRCKLTISQPISLLLEHMINVLYLGGFKPANFFGC